MHKEGGLCFLATWVQTADVVMTALVHTSCISEIVRKGDLTTVDTTPR